MGPSEEGDRFSFFYQKIKIYFYRSLLAFLFHSSLRPLRKLWVVRWVDVKRHFFFFIHEEFFL